jgi:hypothetical protein
MEVYLCIPTGENEHEITRIFSSLDKLCEFVIKKILKNKRYECRIVEKKVDEEGVG